MATGKARRGAGRHMGRGGEGMAQHQAKGAAGTIHVAFFDGQPIGRTPIAFIEGGELLVWDGFRYSKQIPEFDRGGAFGRRMLAAVCEAASTARWAYPVAFLRGVESIAGSPGSRKPASKAMRRVRLGNRAKGKQRP